ncbi:MAG: hypothetical protein EOO56_27965, partial [Hymenobacter sp.]
MPTPTLSKPAPSRASSTSKSTKAKAATPTPKAPAAPAIPSQAPVRDGFGALPHPNGTTFR